MLRRCIGLSHFEILGHGKSQEYDCNAWKMPRSEGNHKQQSELFAENAYYHLQLRPLTFSGTRIHNRDTETCLVFCVAAQLQTMTEKITGI